MPRKIKPVRVEGKVAFIPLSQGYEAMIDVDDIKIVDDKNWSATVTPHTVYAHGRMKRMDGTLRRISIHREIMGNPVGMEVDHISGNALDNRRENLRILTHSDNVKNARIRNDNTSGYKGVMWHKATQKWLSKIQINGKRIHLGLFDTPAKAHAAYCEASARLHGDFGRTS